AAVLGDSFEIGDDFSRQVCLGLQLVLGEQASLDPLGQVHLLLGSQQTGAADRLEVRVHRVAHDRSLVIEVNLGFAGTIVVGGHRQLRRGPATAARTGADRARATTAQLVRSPIVAVVIVVLLVGLPVPSVVGQQRIQVTVVYF